MSVAITEYGEIVANGITEYGEIAGLYITELGAAVRAIPVHPFIRSVTLVGDRAPVTLRVEGGQVVLRSDGAPVRAQ